MSNFQRRDFLTGAAAFTAATTTALMGPKPAEAGDPSFMNNVPDPVLAGKELPTFKFELEKSQGRVIDGDNWPRPRPRHSHPLAGALQPPRQSVAASASWLSLYSRPRT